MFSSLSDSKRSSLAVAVTYSAAAISCAVFIALFETGIGLAAVAEFRDHWGFTGLGVLGAIFANSTGAGGGVVFIPAFAQLGFTEEQAVATSFGIQSFGMTVGALSWLYYFHCDQRPRGQWPAFFPCIALCSAFSAAGLWSVFGGDIGTPARLATMFAVFSLFLGASILVTVKRQNTAAVVSHNSLGLDMLALAVIAYFGGMVTAWLSVGVGEFVAIYLILRRYDVTFSVAVAVIVSAVTVWCASPAQVIGNAHLNWEVLAFAGPGAVVGALLARPIVLALGARRLKVLFAGWLLVVGVVEFLLGG